jgi:threonine/homoserine/homoserine lactone efflux protein
MEIESAGVAGGYWVVFSFSFLVALTGAMAPGPLLTYTIIKSARSRKYGYLMGAWVIAGHAILEMGIVLLLLFGFSYVLQHMAVVRGIGLVGGVILIWFGISIMRDVVRGRIPVGIAEEANGEDAAPSPSRKRAMDHPVVGGALVSMSNPYWWVWWATIGFAFMVEFGISFDNFPKLLAFFIGHEAGDLAWYLIVSALAYFGLRRLNRRVYYGVLALCGLFMIGFGCYLGASPFFRSTL